MGEERCLSCGRVLFRSIRVDEMGHTVIRYDLNIELKEQGYERVFRCPACQAQHVLATKKNALGIPQLILSHVIE